MTRAQAGPESTAGPLGDGGPSLESSAGARAADGTSPRRLMLTGAPAARWEPGRADQRPSPRALGSVRLLAGEVRRAGPTSRITVSTVARASRTAWRWRSEMVYRLSS